VFYLW